MRHAEELADMVILVLFVQLIVVIADRNHFTGE